MLLPTPDQIDDIIIATIVTAREIQNVIDREYDTADKEQVAVDHEFIDYQLDIIDGEYETFNQINKTIDSLNDIFWYVT